MTAFSIRSCDNHVSIFAIADEMEKKGIYIHVYIYIDYNVIIMYTCARMW